MSASYTKKVAYNAISQLMGKVIATAMAIWLISLLTKYLGVAQYGQYTTIFAYASFWTLFADFGLIIVMVKELSQKPEEKEIIVGNVFSLRLALASLVFLLSIIVVQFLPYDPAVKTGVIYIGLAFLLQTMITAFGGFFQANYQIHKAVIGDILGKLICLLMIIWAISGQRGFMTILAAYILGNGLNLFFNYLLARRLTPIRWLINWPIWRRLLSQSLPIAIISLFGYLYFRSDMLLLSLMKSNYDVGIYGPTYKILDILIVLPSFLTHAAFPAVALFYVQDRQRLNRVLQKIFDSLLTVALPLGVGGFLLAEKILVFLAGRDFITPHIFWRSWQVGGVQALQILMLAVIVSYMNAILGSAVIAANQQKRLILPTLIYAIFNIGFNLLFIPRFSYLAASASTFLTEVLIFIFSYYIFRQVVGYRLSFTILPKIFLAVAVMAAVIYWLPNLHLLLVIAISGAVYLIFGWWLGLIRRDIIQELWTNYRS